MKRPTPSKVHFTLLGSASWQTDGSPIALTNLDAALVACAALGPRSRRVLARLFWPMKQLSKGRDNIRKHTQRLKASTKQTCFTPAENLTFAPGVKCDVLASAKDKSDEELLAQEELLKGIEFSDKSPLQSRLTEQRRDWNKEHAGELIVRAARSRASGHLDLASRLYTRALEVMPDSEDAALENMRLLFLTGHQTAALEAYDKLVLSLKASGKHARSEIESLARAIRQSDTLSTNPLNHPPLLIGREREKADMRDACNAGRPIILLGAGGIGKSRLLHDFLRQFDGVITIRARHGDSSTPYYVLAESLREIIVRHGVKLDAALSRSLSPILHELGRVPDAPPADEGELRQAVERLLELAEAAGLKILAVDGLDAADCASVATWRWLAAPSNHHSIRFAFAMRSPSIGALQDLFDAWQTDPWPPRLIQIMPWTMTEVGRLLESLNVVWQDRSVTTTALHAHTGGNPFFVLETLRQYQTYGVDTIGGKLPFPIAAVSLLSASLHRLRQTTLKLLQLHAVLGRDMLFTAAAMGLLHGETEHVMRELDSMGMLKEGNSIHDLMREAVVNSMSETDTVECSEKAAQILVNDGSVPPARIAALWSIAKRWPDAALHHSQAGANARLVGKLPDALAHFNQAAECFRRAGDPTGQFDAIYESLDGTIEFIGHIAGQKVVDQLRAMAKTPIQRARWAIANADVQAQYHQHGTGALDAAREAVRLSKPFDELRGQALAALALACSQARRFGEAVNAGEKAVALLKKSSQRRKALEISANMAYVFHEAGRFGDAIKAGLGAALEYEAYGDAASAAIIEANVATLYLQSGEPQAAIGPALSAHNRHCTVSSSAAGLNAVNNRSTLCMAYAHVGHFQDALQILDLSLLHELPTAVDARARLAISNVWLVLGDKEKALAALGSTAAGWRVSAQVERCWALFRAAAITGHRVEEQLRRIAEIHPGTSLEPLPHAPWIAWSRQGDARTVIDQLKRVGKQYQRAGMLGMARTAKLLRVLRLADLGNATSVETAATLARELVPEVDAGMQAVVYVPEAWWILGRALKRAGEETAAAECLENGRRWISLASPRVPDECRDSFLYRNPWNRLLFADTTESR